MTELTRISRRMTTGISDAFADVLQPVLDKHRQTLDRLDELMKAGYADRASRLWRRSGMLDDLARAIASAGAVSADVIRDALTRIREAVSDDTG